jgi:ABC-type nitrate/sulfonate/bicarbonate transport system ATPase subunit
MYKRLFKSRSQNFVLDLVERHNASCRIPRHDIKDSFDLSDAIARVPTQPTTFDRVMIDDRFESEEIVRVDPIGKLLVFRPLLEVFV